MHDIRDLYLTRPVFYIYCACVAGVITFFYLIARHYARIDDAKAEAPSADRQATANSNSGKTTAPSTPPESGEGAYLPSPVCLRGDPLLTVLPLVSPVEMASQGPQNPGSPSSHPLVAGQRSDDVPPPLPAMPSANGDAKPEYSKTGDMVVEPEEPQSMGLRVAGLCCLLLLLLPTDSSWSWPVCLCAGIFRRIYPFAFPALAAVIGGQSLIFAKTSVELIKSTTSISNQFIYPEPYFSITGLLTTLFFQMRYLNSGLARFDALFVIPVYQVVWMVAGILGGGIVFREFEAFNTIGKILFPIGACITFSGIYLLTQRDDSTFSATLGQRYRLTYDVVLCACTEVVQKINDAILGHEQGLTNDGTKNVLVWFGTCLH